MIKFIDFIREYNSIKSDINKAINLVLKSGQYILGEKVREFEKNFASYCKTKYCVGVNSGTDALYLSLLSAGIGKGDEVIVPVNTAMPTAIAVLMSGATPVFVDCDEDFLIDIKQIPAVITKKTKAIIPVHLYGKACDMSVLMKLAKKFNLFIIEDCAQANGASWRNKKIGSWGDFGCFSFYPVKNLGAYGDGGAITTNNKNYYQKLLRLRFYGQEKHMESAEFGVNSRLDEMQAAILNVKLAHLNDWNNRRQEIAKLYRKLITNPNVILPLPTNKNNHVYHLFVIRVKQRDKLMKFLKQNNITTLIHYPVPLHKQPTFKKNAHGLFPRAEMYANELISLPMYPFLKDSEVNRIATVINKFIV